MNNKNRNLTNRSQRPGSQAALPGQTFSCPESPALFLPWPQALELLGTLPPTPPGLSLPRASPQALLNTWIGWDEGKQLGILMLSGE